MGIPVGGEEQTHKKRFNTYFPDEDNRLWALVNTEDVDPLRFDLFSTKTHEYLGSLDAPDQTQSAHYISGGKIVFQFENEDPELFRVALFEIVDNK